MRAFHSPSPLPSPLGLSVPHNSTSQAGESQRDSGSKPRVASRELPLRLPRKKERDKAPLML